ncbi:hypothetical protein ACPROK_07380 [Glutamicibacter soli]|uniref:hypothetical protein n=1 Tax=Glutamicibacter soli TaxID=453836 RepID=UPI003C774025
MVPAEQFACRIASANSVKDDVIYCSARPVSGLELWTVLGSVATAVFTLGLLIAAVVAGIYAARSFSLQIHEQKESLRRFDVDISEREHHAHQVRVDAATMRVIDGIVGIIEASKKSQEEVLSASSGLRAATVQYNLIWEFSAKERSRIDRFVSGLVLLARAASYEDLRAEGALAVLDDGYTAFCDIVSELSRGEIDMDDFTKQFAENGNAIRSRHERWFFIADARLRGEEYEPEFPDAHGS